MKILVADNRSTLGEKVRKAVKTASGVKLVEEASNGYEAYSKICKTKYDLVVLNISLQGMSGLDILQEMKNDNNRTRTLLYSETPQQQYAKRALELGAAGLMSSSSSLAILNMAIGQIVVGESFFEENAEQEKERFSKGIVLEGESTCKQISEKSFQLIVLFNNGKSAMKNCALTVHVG